MKALLALCLSLLAAFAWAKEAPSASVVKGEVLEVKNSGGYTYLRLKTGAGEKWAAVDRSVVKIGAQVSIGNPMVMHDFESRSLKKTFPEIVFGNLAGAAGGTTKTGWDNAMTPGGGKPRMGESAIHVPKATGANAYTVEEIVTRSKALKDKSVVVRGKVVKFNAAIMGKNWVHVRDGSGSATAESDDLLVTTQAMAKVGDVVTVKGVVRTNKDFGAGYAYEVLIDEATLQP